MHFRPTKRESQAGPSNSQATLPVQKSQAFGFLFSTTGFFDETLDRMFFERKISKDLFELPVLFFQLFQAFYIRDLHTAKLALPVVVRASELLC